LPEAVKTKIAVVMVTLFVIAVYSSITVTTAQTTHTSTLTQTAVVYSTSVQQTTLTSPTTVYTTTVETLNSTIQGTQTQIVPSVTTLTSTITSAVGGMVTATNTITLTTVSTQTTQMLGNIWGESLALVVLVGAIASFIVPKARPRTPKGVVCRNCGTVNPPFAATFCVKCGHSLKGTN
jgi:ribosomal protein L40E